MACGGLNPLFASHMDPAAGLRGALGYPAAAFGLGPFGSHHLHPHSVFGGFGGPSGFGGVPTSAVGSPATHSASLAAAGESSRGNIWLDD